MLASRYLLASMREEPSEAEITSHKLMLKAGMIRKLTSGIYTWLPTGLRVLKKVENIIRKEMNITGALEVLMPAIQPANLWIESGRWNLYGEQLLRIRDRNLHDFCFGPTHEEVITDMIRYELKSYKQLPAVFFQFQTKFRDEIRPRFGVIRSREFIMKDAYSFHLNEQSMHDTYNIMYDTYKCIFKKLGLKFRIVLADNGNIGGNKSHEFQALADIGEDTIVFSDQSEYAANIEKAECFNIPYQSYNNDITCNKIKLIDIPDLESIEDIKKYLNIDSKKLLKIVFVKGKDYPCIALVLREDHELNDLKISKLPDVQYPLYLLDVSEVQKILGCKQIFAGPIDLNVPMIVDQSVITIKNFVCGANIDNKFFINANWQYDISIPDRLADLRKVTEGDISPDGKGKLKFARGVEVGQIFQLGNKYSKSMKAMVLDSQGKMVNLFMGCYGIGVSRVIAAIIEQNYDSRGIIWPNIIAPFQVAIIPIGFHKSLIVRNVAEKIYDTLQKIGYDVLLEDRMEHPGVMFKDIDLVGIPHKIIISQKTIETGIVEYKSRINQTNVVEKVKIDHIYSFMKRILNFEVI